MRRRRLMLRALLPAALSLSMVAGACQSSDQEDRLQHDIEALRAELQGLESSRAQHRARLEELSARLQELQGQQTAPAAALAGPDRPGGALPVIRLGPTAAAEGSYSVVGATAQPAPGAGPADGGGVQPPHPAGPAARPGPAQYGRLAADPADPVVKVGALSGPRSAMDALRRLAAGQAGQTLEVLHYGDSHTVASGLADELRRGLSASGVVSPGYVSVGFPLIWETKVQPSAGWSRKNWLASRDRGPFGPLGIAFVTRKAGAEMKVEIKGKSVPRSGIEVTTLYSRTPQQLPFRVQVNGRTLATVSPPASDDPEHTLGTSTVVLPDGASSLSLVVTGEARRPEQELRFFGFQIRYARADVGWDVLGVGGTTVLQPLQRGDDTIPQYFRRRDPDLVVVWFGTNSALERDLDLGKYVRKYSTFLERLRTMAPRAQCLAIGPPDLSRRAKGCFPAKEPGAQRGGGKLAGRPKRICDPDGLVLKEEGRTSYPVPGVDSPSQWQRYKEECSYHTLPGLRDLDEAQRTMAHERGCAYFDVFEFMGGDESMVQWACQEEPQLAQFDFVHLTQAGYRKVARGILSALKAPAGSLR